MGRYTFLIVFIVLISSCTSKLTKTLKSTDPEYKLKVAEQYYAQGKYNQAQILFEDLFPLLKGTPKFEDLYFKYAYTAYNLKDYLNAENLFKSFAETFPNSPRAEEADFMRAYSYYKLSPKAVLDQTNTMKAIGQMQVFINTHPGSPRRIEASNIIDELRAKLEIKDQKNAELYFNLGYYRAAAIAYESVMENFPDTDKADEYKLMMIKSYYLYALNSIEAKQKERFEKVLDECQDFIDRFPESKLADSVKEYKTLSVNKINNTDNEQTKKAA